MNTTRCLSSQNRTQCPSRRIRSLCVSNKAALPLPCRSRRHGHSLAGPWASPSPGPVRPRPTLVVSAFPPLDPTPSGDLDDAEQTQQVALFALIPVALMTIKWLSSTGPAALLPCAALLSVPIAGRGIRTMLKEGFLMARWWLSWARAHQHVDTPTYQRHGSPPPTAAWQTQGAPYVPPYPANHHHNGSAPSSTRQSVPRGDYAVQDVQACQSSPQGPHSTWPKQQQQHMPAYAPAHAHHQGSPPRTWQSQPPQQAAPRWDAYGQPGQQQWPQQPAVPGRAQAPSRQASPNLQSVSSLHSLSSLQSVDLVDLDWPVDTGASTHDPRNRTVQAHAHARGPAQAPQHSHRPPAHPSN